MVGLELAAFDLREEADRADRMLIHGIVMIHVELHLRDDAPEVRNEAAEYARLVHPPQHDLGRMHRRQDFDEERVGARVVAYLAIYEHRVTGGGTHRCRVNLEPLARGEREQVKQANGVGTEKIVRRHCQPAAIEHKSAKALGLAADGRQGEAETLLAELLIELGKEHARQIAYRFRVQEIELHETLDRGFPRPVGVIHDLRDALLIVEAEPLLGAAGEQVQMAAHGPKEALGPVEAAELGRRQKAGSDKVRWPLDPMHVFSDPVECVEVAKTALAVFDVGLDDIAAVAHADVALVALGELCRHEFGGGPGDHVLAETAHRGVEQFVVAP